MPRTEWGKQLGRSLIATLAIGAGIVSADGVRHYHVKPQRLCGVPPAEYQPPRPPPVVVPVVAVSSVGYVLTPPLTQASLKEAMSLQVPGKATKSPRIKVFQFTLSSLQIDHCSISRLCLTVYDNGFWRFSCQGDQNPIVETATALTTVQRSATTKELLPTSGRPPLPVAQIQGLPAGEAKYTAFLKRNLFVIRVRGLGDFREPLPVPPAPPSLGKPVLFSLPVIEFWVQNGVPYPLVRTSGPNGDVRQFFDMIDRVEVEFSYR
jgi:hypothetical protein